MAKGEIIGWLWSDDVYLYKTTVSEAVEFLCNYPNVDVVYGNLVIFNRNGIISRIQSSLNFLIFAVKKMIEMVLASKSDS